MTQAELNIDWGKVNGLVPAIVQDGETLQVLMLGYMNKESLAATLKSKRVTFYSRSRQALWVKGETSGNFLKLVDVGVTTDCDRDALLVKAIPMGPTCHLNTTSCFGKETAPGLGFLAQLSRVIEQRAKDMPDDSYTTRLFREGISRMAQKVGEEGLEVALAAKGLEHDEFVGEAADLLFHLLVLCRGMDIELNTVIERLRQRHTV